MSTTGAQFWTQQYLDSNGNPYGGVLAYHYVPGTTTDTDVWTDEAKTTPAAQPVVGDSAGRVSFYGDNTYRIVIKSSGGTTLYDWDNVKLMHKDVTLRAENRAQSYPSATSATRGHIFGKVNGSGTITEVGVNLDGSSYSPIQFQGGTITTRQQTWDYGADIASATTLTLGSDGNVFDVTGNTTITGISSTTLGTPIILRMQGQAQLQHNATSLILWNGLNWTPETGDVIFLESLGSGNYYEVSRRSNSILSDPQELQNVALSAGVSGNALTVSLKTRSGDDPSGTDLCRIGFRNPTLTTGTYNTRTVSSAKSVVISNGSTLGATNSQHLRLWVIALDAESASAGAGVELGLWNAYSKVDTGISAIREGSLYTSTAEGGAGGADSAHVLYSTTARANVPVRVLGYVEIQAGSSGAWSNSPTVVQIMGPGVKRAGDMVQYRYTYDSNTATGTTTLPFDTSIPQNTEGNQFMTRAITPTAACNLLEISAELHLALSASSGLGMALFQDTTADAISAASNSPYTTGSGFLCVLTHRMLAGTTSATTFKIRAGTTGAATTTFNTNYNSAISSYMDITEYFV